MASELEICDLAYKGDLQQLIVKSEDKPSIFEKKDNVCTIFHIYFVMLNCTYTINEFYPDYRPVA